MRADRPTKPLEVTAEEQEKLELLARCPKSSQALAMRVRRVLNCAAGLTNEKVAEKLIVTRPTVGKWRERFREHRLEGLLDEQGEAVVTTTLEAMPAHRAHWSLAADGKPVGPVANRDCADLGSFWIAATSGGIRGEGQGHCRVVPEPAGNAMVLGVDEKSYSPHGARSRWIRLARGINRSVPASVEVHIVMTITERRRWTRCASGSPAIPVTTSTSPPPAPAGSIW